MLALSLSLIHTHARTCTLACPAHTCTHHAHTYDTLTLKDTPSRTWHAHYGLNLSNIHPFKILCLLFHSHPWFAGFSLPNLCFSFHPHPFIAGELPYFTISNSHLKAVFFCSKMLLAVFALILDVFPSFNHMLYSDSRS